MIVERMLKIINLDKYLKVPSNYFSYGCYSKQKDELKKLNVKRVKLSEFCNCILKSCDYNILKETLLSINREFLYTSYIHGIRHNVRTSLFAFYLAKKLNLGKREIKLVLYAAMYHDTGRENDCEDLLHGKRSADNIDKLKLDINQEESLILKTAIECHSLPDEEFEKVVKRKNVQNYDLCKLIFKILKDSDGLDRVRLYYPYVKLSFLRLNFSKELIPVAYELEYNMKRIESDINLIDCKKICHKMYHLNARRIVDKQIETFFEIENSKFKLSPHGYNVGDDVILNKDKFLHGTGRNENTVDFVSRNGILAKESVGILGRHAVRFVAGFWRVFETVSLRDYIINYSGMDVAYEKAGESVPYGKLDEFVEKMRNVDHWKWKAESPMEIRFMPSLARDINQYGFILNIASDEAKGLIKYDVNTDKFNNSFKSKFGLSNLKGKGKKDGVFNYTKRASYVIFGMNRCFIEGILVGRKVERDNQKLKDLKAKFPNCYICNLDGKVIVV